MNILNIEHVSKVFGEKVVLDDVSYGVHQGDKIGIIGINGTGKSTILKIIGGLEDLFRSCGYYQNNRLLLFDTRMA